MHGESSNYGTNPTYIKAAIDRLESPSGEIMTDSDSRHLAAFLARHTGVDIGALGTRETRERLDKIKRYAAQDWPTEDWS